MTKVFTTSGIELTEREVAGREQLKKMRKHMLALQHPTAPDKFIRFSDTLKGE